MPKLKSNRGAKKRFKITARGKVKKKNAYGRHILTSKTRRQKRRLRGTNVLKPCDAGFMNQLLPYG